MDDTDNYAGMIVEGQPAREMLNRRERARLLMLKWEMQQHGRFSEDCDDEAVWRGPHPSAAERSG